MWAKSGTEESQLDTMHRYAPRLSIEKVDLDLRFHAICGLIWFFLIIIKMYYSRDFYGDFKTRA